MKITITDMVNIYTFDVELNEEIENIKALIQVETNIPWHRQKLMFQGKVLQDKQILSDKGIKEGAILDLGLVQEKKKQSPPSSQQVGTSIAEMIKKFDKQRRQGPPEKKLEQFIEEAQKTYLQLKDDHYKLSQLSDSLGELVSFVFNKDIKGIAGFLKQKHDERAKKIFEERKKFQELSKDPMNPEYQKMLEERIRQQNVQKNLEYAHEYIPEVFGHITMLYINASVNKVPIQAFVDSGAQTTVMSESLAHKCGLMRLLDKRQAGRAVGVGSCKILGKIHAAEIEIENKFFTCSFTVIQNNDVQFLLGLDMLKRFNCLIDLKNDQLIFQDGLIKTKFLSDGEVNKTEMPTKSQIQAKMKKLNDMGFSSEQSLKALKTCNFNEEIAASMLMHKKFGK